MAGFDGHPERRPAVVTGASSGIGEATARALALASHPVVLGARRVERCEEVAAEIRGQGGEAAAVFLDVTDPGSVKDFATAADQAMGPVEVLVCNAGDVLLGRGIDTPPDDFAAQVQVNLLGAQRLAALLAPPMIERNRGDLVFITSDAVRLPRPGVAAYVASKWGLEGLARTLQLELEGTGVRASIVRPGPTLTGMGSGWEPEVLTVAMEEWARFGMARHDGYLAPEHVARAVLAVVSMPPGSHLTLVEVEPEAPVHHDRGGTP